MEQTQNCQLKFDTTHIVRKAGKKFKKSQKLDVLDLYEIDMGGPFAPSVPCTVHKNDFYSLVWLWELRIYY